MLIREDFYENEEHLPKRDLFLEKNPWKEYEMRKNHLREELLDCKEYELRIREIVEFLEI